ncbi:hypothetical protein [Paenibacillus sp. 2TAB26]
MLGHILSRGTALAAAYDLPVVPHVGEMGQIHQHLVGATHNAIILEYFP